MPNKDEIKQADDFFAQFLEDVVPSSATYQIELDGQYVFEFRRYLSVAELREMSEYVSAHVRKCTDKGKSTLSPQMQEYNDGDSGTAAMVAFLAKSHTRVFKIKRDAAEDEDGNAVMKESLIEGEPFSLLNWMKFSQKQAVSFLALSMRAQQEADSVVRATEIEAYEQAKKD